MNMLQTIQASAIRARRPVNPADDNDCEEFAIEARNEAVKALRNAAEIINRYSSRVTIDMDAVEDFISDNFPNEDLWREKMAGR